MALDATGVADGAGQGAEAAQQPAQQAAAAGPAPAPPPPPAPASPAPASASPAPASPEFVGVRDALATYGLDLRNQFQDDHAALAHIALLARQAEQNAHLAQYGQKYVEHADQFQAWLRERQQQEQAKQQQATQWWKAPEYDPAWAQKLTRDPQTGEIKAVPGADPAIVQKYAAWVDHQRGFLERFAQNPIEAIRPGIEQLVRAEAEKLVQQQLGGYQERTSAQAWVQQNSSWLHERDAQGAPVRNPQTGEPVLSALGQAFRGHVNRAVELGLSGVEAQREYAMAMTQRDYAVAQLKGGQQQQQPAAAPAVQQTNEQAKAAFLGQAAGGRGTGAPPVSPTGNTNGSTPPVASQRQLADLMMAELTANGFSAGQRVFG